MRSWHELTRALDPAEMSSVFDLDPEEREAVLYTSLMLGVHKPLVPVSWAKSRLHPAGCLLATSLFRPGEGLWGPLTGRLLGEPFQLPASCEVFGEIISAAIEDRLLRVADVALLRTRAENRTETIVQAGPRLLASLGEERERWAPIW